MQAGGQAVALRLAAVHLPLVITGSPSMRRELALATAATLVASLTAGAQEPAAAPKTPPPAVGAVAPDFTLPGATRYGLLAKPASLSDYKGKTVVLAFFFRARTRG